MTYPLSDTQPSPPPDPGFGQGRDIDDDEWADVAGVAHWHDSRRSSMDIVYFNPAGQSVSASSADTWTVLSSDGVGGNADRALFIDPDRQQRYHDAWQDGDYLLEILALMSVQSVTSTTTLQVALDLGGFGTGVSGDGRQQDTTTRTPMIEPPVGGAELGWHSRHVMVRAGDDPIWGVPVVRAPNGSEGGTVYAIAVRQMWAVNEQTFRDSLYAFIPHHVTDPMVGDGASIPPASAPTSIDQDGAELDFIQGTASWKPSYAAGALNAGDSSLDPVDAVHFDAGTEYLYATESSWGTATFVFCIAIRRETTDAAVIWESTDGATPLGLRIRQTSPANDLVAEVITGDGTFQTTIAHDGTGVWEDYTVVWTQNTGAGGGNGDLVLYQNGSEVDRVTTTGSIAASTVTHYLGHDQAQETPFVGDVAMPAFFDMNADPIDLQRILGWRRSYTGTGPVVDVT